MRIGLFAPTLSPTATREYLERLGRSAEERGFHSLWLGEHVVLFDAYTSRYPYATDGRIPVSRESGLLDSHSALAFLAAVTSKIRLGTGICLVPQRNPVYTAHEIATIDWLSRGRVDFGVGVGWLREEFEALGVPFARRGARTREAIELIQRLWCDEVSAYEGDFYSLPPCRQYPKPVQSPHPPIFFGGESDAALQRVADLGQGWHPFLLAPEELAARLKDLDARLRARGRSRAEIEVVVSPYTRPLDSDGVKRYRDAGADQVVAMALGRDVDELERNLDRVQREILEPARNVE